MTVKPESLRFLVWVGLADVLLGLGLATAFLSGLFGPGLELAAAAAGLVAAWGVVLFVWGRNKLSQVEDRRGDLN